MQSEYKDFESYQLIWEILKVNLKEFTMEYCETHSKAKSDLVKLSQKKLDETNENIALLSAKQVLTSEDKNMLETFQIQKLELENNLGSYYNDKAKGHWVRSRTKWIEEGEVNSRYFLGLEKQIQGNNVIRKVKCKDAFVVNDKEILNETVKFYNNLYSRTNVNNRNIDSFFERVKPKVILNDHEKQFCDANITKEELSDIVHSLKQNKSPGLDGLTSEFYQTFWEELQCIFIRMIDESFKKGILPCSIKKAVITLIFKKGDRTLLKNYRPISLTNCDYKILTFVLARRIQKVISKLISNDQSGYIKGRYIGFNARLINDIIENCEGKNLPGAIVCLDFEKAFDSLDWSFMIKSLKRYGFGDYFTRWIEILYTSPTYCIKNNGWISKESTMNRGIRQGCAVSALLFILAVEFLSVQMKQNENVKGISVSNTESKLLQYADDSTLTLMDSQSISYALHEIKIFTDATGLKLNVNKSEGLWLGNLKQNKLKFEGISFSEGPIKCLGIYIGTNMENCSNLNWDKKLNDIDILLAKWNK